ncbi:MAG TPA: tetratricopeptide repeat protein [Candidatus Sulfotelmatobacter sp.]|nr:tetratricopeptide repeat protein [Candidatus Sulfotelmatobacter sp.]
MGKANQISNQQGAPWIYNPALDLIVGCGAWSAPLLLLSYFSLATSARAWAVAFYALAFVFNYPHYMATIYRAYHRAEDFQKYRVFTVHITALMVLTLLLSHFWLRLLPWIFTIYLTWSPWHYSGQNYGLFMMFARRAGADPDKTARRALYGAFIASYLILFLGFHTGPSTDSLFISLGIPAVVSRWEQVALGIAFVGLSVFGLSRLARATGWRKLIPSLTLFSSQFLWFLLPAAISLIKGLEIPQNRYSSGVLAVMHSAQYLWITSYYARREASGDASTSSTGKRNWRPFAYFGLLIVGGIALFVPGPWLASRAFHHDFTASFLIFTALVNIHHFILDGAIWKLRDGRIASLLLNSRELISDAASEAGGHFAAAGRWLVGGTASARSLRVSVALLLLVWGTLDQARYYLALQTDDLHDLQRAASLNSFDASLQMRMGRKAMEDGQPQQAEAAWRRAMQANPADPAARQALLQFLIDQDRYDEALNLTQTALKYTPKDANLLVDRGLLELRRGDGEHARADWDAAIAADPGQLNAHLYLADELDHEGKAQAAASHYNAYLERIARQGAQGRPPADKVIAVAIRMADCQARSSQTDLAIKSYRLAEKLAAQTGQPKLESVADVNEAALLGQNGKLSEALQLYQRALEIDKASGDDNAAADDWFSYGRFLDDAGFPARLAYACLVKSESLKRSGPDVASTDSRAAVRKQMEKRLGVEAASLGRNPEPALREALALRR